jgi:outer membrane receptor protein involved in Fe transport
LSGSARQPYRPRLRLAVCGAALAALCAPCVASAAPSPQVVFDIPSQPLGEALVRFGLQAGVSVGAGDLSRCGPVSRRLNGRFTPAAGLARLLAGTGCMARAVDARAFSVQPRPEVAQTAGPASAPATPAPPTEVVLDLTVTATRRPSLVSRTPASVSVVSGADLTSARIESLSDLAPEFAGVTVTNLGPGRNKVLVRGLSDGAFTGRTQSTVGLYLDDTPITYNAPDPDLRLVDVEQVELMRGPQGPLYGLGSMGGIVRVVTHKPELSRFSAGAAVGAAVTRTGDPSYALDAMLNVPVAQDRLAVRGVGYVETAGGYVDNVGLGLKNVNGTARQGGRLAVTAALSPDWQLALGGVRQSMHSNDAQYIQGGVGGLRRSTKVREPNGSDFSQLYASVEGALPWARLRVTAALSDHFYGTRSDASNGLAVFVARTDVGAFDQDYRIQLAMAEAVLTSSTGGRLQWLAGVFASRTREAMYLDISEFGSAGPRQLFGEERHDRLGEVAVYGEASYAIDRRWTLTAGLRGFHAWLDTDSIRHQQAIPLTFAGSLDSAKLSPKAVLSWQASPTKLFYAQAAQGYRTGGFNTTGRIAQQFNASRTGNQPNRQYRPDTVWSFEAGSKMSFEDRRWELRLAAFYTDWRDVQSDQFLNSGLPYTANVGRAVNTGFEGEVAYRLGSSLTLRANALIAGPQLTERDRTYPARPNASLPAVPRYSAAVSGEWRPELRPGLTGVFYGRLGYVGASILTYQEQAASQMGNYVTARLAAGVETRRWRLTAYVDNPADAEGDTFAFGDPFTQGRVRQSTPLRPRTFGLTLAAGL